MEESWEVGYVGRSKSSPKGAFAWTIGAERKKPIDDRQLTAARAKLGTHSFNL
jgi:hypothetical protein